MKTLKISKILKTSKILLTIVLSLIITSNCFAKGKSSYKSHAGVKGLTTRSVKPHTYHYNYHYTTPSKGIKK